MFIVAARAQRKNDSCPEFNKAVLNIVNNVQGVNLLSVSTDGVAYERSFLMSHLVRIVSYFMFSVGDNAFLCRPHF